MNTTCACGRPIPVHVGRGRPRLFCTTCRPPRPNAAKRQVLPERPCACGCGRVIQAGGKARFATSACRTRDWKRRQHQQP